MKYLKALVLPLLLIALLYCSKSPNQKQEARFNDIRAVVQVDDQVFTLGELEKRYATITFTDAKQEYEVKKDFSDRFLERFLLIKGALEEGMTANLDSADYKRTLLKQLYNNEIMNRIKVTDKEINNFFEKYGGELQTGRILVYDSTLAESLYQAIADGAEFEKLASEFSEDKVGARRGGSMGYAAFGRYEDRYQELAFGMKMGEVSKPLHTRSGWHIIKLYDRIKNTPEDLARDIDKYREMTHQYQQKTLVRKFITKLRNDYHYEVSPPALNMMIHKADSVKALGNLPDNLPSSAYLDLSVFNDTERAMLLVKYDGGGVTVGEYLNLMRGYDRARAPELRNAELLDEVLEGLASPGLLEKEAFKRGYDKTETYRGEIEYLKGNMLAQMMRDKIYSSLATIEESDIVNYYNTHRDKFIMPPIIKASAISVKTSDEAERLLGRIRGGASFAQLARKYSLDRPTAVKGGDLDYFTVARYTPIYQAAEGLEIGDLGGPVEMEGNWWIFKLTERQPEKPKELDLVRADITSQIGQDWRVNAFNEWIENMKKRANYKIDLDLIRNNLRMGSLPSDQGN